MLGLTTSEATVDRPRPVPDEVLTIVKENCEFTVVGATATDEAAAGGTDCQVGTDPAPVDVKTYPVFELAGSFAKVFPKPTNKSPLVYPLKPVPP